MTEHNKNIYDVLETSYPVAGNVGFGLMVTWNGAHTLRLWQDRFYTDGQDGCWTEIDVRTLSTEPANVFEAFEEAQRWLGDIFEEAEENTK